MIIDGKLLRQEYFPDDVSIRFKCVITKEEFLECYNAWVDHAECSGDIVDGGVLQELPQYHFDRDAFVSTFEQVFRSDEIVELEVRCQQHKQIGDFLLFYSSEEEFYIIHLPSGTIINWYKHLGRTNTCNKDYFTIADLKNLLEKLKADMRKNNNDKR